MTQRDDAADERYYGYDSAFRPFERYIVELYDTPWCSGVRDALAAAAQTARDVGADLTREQIDRITYATLWKIRDMIEREALAQQQTPEDTA
jgi:hypothetical protein